MTPHKDPLIALEQTFEEGRRKGIEEVMKAIDREINYHEYIDERGAEMRHPIAACREIQGYCRALIGEKK